MAELFGRSDGCARGKGGSMHLFDRNTNFLGGHGIVGGHVPIATGVGFAIKYRGTDQVILCFMGESVVNTGAFHEALNMAALWKLPVVYIIENNRYGMGTPVSKTNAVRDMTLRAQGYNMKGILVEEGADCEIIHNAVSEAAESARNGRPVLIEIRTARFQGHSMSDPAKYRTKEELEELKRSQDPIKRLSSKLIDGGALTQDEFKDMDNGVKDEVGKALEECEASPPPDVSTALDYVYSDPVVPGAGRQA
jgi:pyruvate dehydrogenase E1 component alpha subunit